MAKNIEVKGPLAELAAGNRVDVQAVGDDHPNKSKYFRLGHMPPEELVLPFGAMLCVQVLRNVEGKSDDSDVIIPDVAFQTWQSPIYVVTHVGPEKQWAKRGDCVVVPGRVEFVVIRIDGWELLVCHEQQALLSLPTKNVLNWKADPATELQVAAEAAKRAHPVSDIVLAKDYNAMDVQTWATLTPGQRDTWWLHRAAVKPGDVCQDCETCKFPVHGFGAPCEYCESMK